ncbi:MAG: sigma-70 family RNA polymerase sigma factor [Acidimicrobiia bacterium]
MAALTTTANHLPPTEPVGDPLARYFEEIGRFRLLDSAEEVELAQAIEAGLQAQVRLEANEVASGEEQRELTGRVERGRAAKEQFVAANLRLVVANAGRYVLPPGVELSDLIQDGNLGLIRAVEKFDWQRGFKFSTYATWWIRQAISKALLHKTRILRLPEQLAENVPLVRRVRARLVGELGRPPQIEEIAAGAGLNPDQVRAALTVPDTVSWHTPVGDGAILGDFIEDAEGGDPAAQVELDDLATMLREALARLPAREARIVTLRYGLADGQPRRLVDVGAELGLTSERIRQLERQALCRLRHPASGIRETDFL